MAKITAAFGSSHSVMLTAQKEDWEHGFKDADPRNPFYFTRDGKHKKFEELLAAAPPNSADLVTPEKMAQRYDKAFGAMDELRKKIQSSGIDVLLVIGDDQDEVFTKVNTPSFGIYYADTILNGAREDLTGKPWFVRARAQRQEPNGEVNYPVKADLAKYLIRGLCDKHFDCAALNGFAEGIFEGHAFSFIHRKYLTETNIPIVPVFLNTFEEPNQPTPRRCVELGKAIGELIKSYPEDLKIGILASGGLSHFIVEEELDNIVLNAIKNKDLEILANLTPEELMAGSSEIRNWLVAAAILNDEPLKLDWVEYIPGYRTAALTGTGLCFASWA